MVSTPYKDSTLGARPIIAYASSEEKIAIKIIRIFERYKIYGADKITILEKDTELCGKLIKAGIKAEVYTILRLKGIEKKCVVWSTRMPMKSKKEVNESAYTILSRTSCILIIALFDNSCNEYSSVIRKLAPSRLILWDEKTSTKYEDFIAMKSHLKTILG